MHRHGHVYLNAYRFGLFLEDFERFSEEEKILCIRRIRNKHPKQVSELMGYFTADIIYFPEYLGRKEEKKG